MSQQSAQSRTGLLVLSGVMLGCAFPPISFGILAIFGFVPLFIALESFDNYGKSLRYSYIMLFTFNLITLYWPGGFVHGKDVYLMISGVLLLLAHPFFFFVALIPWIFFRKQFGFKYSLLAFPFFWVGFEYLHAVGEIAFPWLTLGNTQTHDLPAIQFASFTGSYGISFWLLWLNVIIYFIYRKIISKEWNTTSVKTILSVTGFLVLYFLPKVYGSVILKNSENSLDVKSKVRVALIQPNIDPFVKWEDQGLPQLDTLLKMTREASSQNIDIAIWPETAIPFYITLPQNESYYSAIKRGVDSLGINLLAGFPDVHYYRANESVPNSSNTTKDGQRFDSFNSSMLMTAHTDSVQTYSKIILVPFAERVPYSDMMSILNVARWNFGLGGWGIGKDTTVFKFKTKSSDNVQFSNAICYESIYPGYVAGFVRKGAQFLVVTTNDSWWGKTSGAYQHEQFSVLRAIENRRWIARCANGGISCFIDPFGHILHPTTLFTRNIVVSEVEPRMDLTFYSQHGDLFAQIVLCAGIVFIVAAVGKKYLLNQITAENEIYRPSQ